MRKVFDNESVKKRLDDITAEYDRTIRELEEFLEENPDAEGEVPEEFLERLYINKNELGDKLQGYHFAIKMNDTAVSGIQDEIRRLEGKIDKKLRVSNYLKERVKRAVDEYGSLADNKAKNKSIITNTLKVSYIKSKTFEAPNLDKVPDEHAYTTVTFRVRRSIYKKEALRLQAIANDNTIVMKTVDTVLVSEFKEAYKDKPDTEVPAWLTVNEGGYLKFS
jgi:hypothetical protein